MAQSVSYTSNNAIALPKFSNPSSKFRGICFYDLTSLPKIRSRGFKTMAVDPRENLDHLQRPKIKNREPPFAPVGLWDRFPTARTIQQMMETMERMVEDPLAFNTNWPSAQPNTGGGYVRGRTPWEIKEGKLGYKMRFDMPGMTKEDVKVWVEEKMLVIKAEKLARKKDNNQLMMEEEEEEENGGGDWSPKSYGRYSCRIALPENVEFEKIKAEVRDGVLYITIPKASKTTKAFDINVD